MRISSVSFRLILSALALVLVVGAAGAQISVVGSMTHLVHTAPGERYSATVSVRNEGPIAETVRLSQTDYRFASDGSVFYDEPGTLPRSNADWIELSAAAVRVLPGEEVPIGYSVRVPDEADREGTYWSVIMVETDMSSGSGADGGVGVRHLMRFAVQVISEFPGGEGSLATVEAGLERDPGGVDLGISVANTGTRMLRPEISVELYARDGSQYGPYVAPAQRLYPGTSARFVVPLADAPLGEYRAVAILDAGGHDVFAVQYTLDLN